MANDPSSAVVHLTLRRGELELAVGSGILYRKGTNVYIVTAWHNVTGRHSESLKPLSKTAAVPDNLIAYIACKVTSNSLDGDHFLRRPFTISLENDSQAFYLIHPQGYPRVDVAVIPIDPEFPYPSEGQLASGEKTQYVIPMRQSPSVVGVGFDISCIQDFEEAASQLAADFANYITISDDLFIVGYPKGIIDYTGQPLWKRATVATAPHLGWNRQKQFLVDCASREGMSGAPAIFHTKDGAIRLGGSVHIGASVLTFLAGIYVARLGHVSEFEAQIGTIWQRCVIDEIIDQGVVAPHSSQLMALPAEVKTTIEVEWPDNEDYAPMILGDNSYSKIFTHHVAQKLNGRADPDKVEEMVLEFAKSKIKHNYPPMATLIPTLGAARFHARGELRANGVSIEIHFHEKIPASPGFFFSVY
jgi:hypothetical protein